MEKDKPQTGDKEQPAADAPEAPDPVSVADDASVPAAVEVKQGFAGMEIKGQMFTDLKEAGEALLKACNEVKVGETVDIGTYRGFTMSLSNDDLLGGTRLTLKGKMSYHVDISDIVFGKLARFDQELERMPERLQAAEEHLRDLYQQQAAAKTELGKPFPKEEEVRVKSARLAELDVALNIDHGPAPEEQISAKSTRPSVMEKLKQTPPVRNTPQKPPIKDKEVR